MERGLEGPGQLSVRTCHELIPGEEDPFPPGLVVRAAGLGHTHLPSPPLPASSLSVGSNTREQTVSIEDPNLVLVTATSSGPGLQNKCTTRHL